MKMSQAMQLLGYGALPNGGEIIRKAQAKEARPDESLPCGTCGHATGFSWNGFRWCVNTKCEDFHTTFTEAEWQARATEKLIEAHRAEY